jgi:hypothetical protein
MVIESDSAASGEPPTDDTCRPTDRSSLTVAEHAVLASCDLLDRSVHVPRSHGLHDANGV